METTEEIKRFLKTPKKGDIVKVYHQKKCSYGIVEMIIIDDDLEEKYKKTKREIVLLKKTQQEYPLINCDFCLPESKIKFI
jgi:hypothetical protein